MKTNLLLSEDAIRQRACELGEQISATYNDGSPVLCVCVLKGAFMFFGELVKRIKGDVILDFLTLSSYNGANTTGQVRLINDIKEFAQGRHVLIVEDIVDSGYTVEFLKKHFEEKGALSVKVACLIDRPLNRKVNVETDFSAFTVTSNRFLVGYGLDFNQRYRNMGYISEVEFE